MKQAATTILAILLLPIGALAAPRSSQEIERQIAEVKKSIAELEHQITARAEIQSEMIVAREECDRLDAIYAGYLARLTTHMNAANAAWRLYKEKFRLATLSLGDGWHSLWWSFCNKPYLGRLANWKWYGPHAGPFTKARDDFWAKREAFEQERSQVHREIAANAELLSLGLRPSRDFQGFKKEYQDRKARCDQVVRPYFSKPRSDVQLRRRLTGLRRRLAQLEEELSRNASPPAVESSPASIQVRVPRPERRDRHRIQAQGFTAGAGLAVHGHVEAAAAHLVPNRVYRVAATLNGTTYHIFNRAMRRDGDGPLYFSFAATLPARPGPYTLVLSLPDVPAIPKATITGRLIPPQDIDSRRIQSAERRVAEAQRATGRDPTDLQRSVCNAWLTLAQTWNRASDRARTEQAAQHARAILKRFWPTSRTWTNGAQLTWYGLSQLDAQAAFERGDVEALEKILSEQASLWMQAARDRSRSGSRPIEVTFKVRDARSSYLKLAETILVLTNDLDRARRIWTRGRTFRGPTEDPPSNKPGYDPVWYAP